MKPFSPVALHQMDVCRELGELKAIFDVCEKTIDAVGVDDLRSVVDVLICTNEWFRRYWKVESEYLTELSNFEDDKTLVRTEDDVFERLTELHNLHSHYDVCSTVVSDLATDDLASLSEVFMCAANRLYQFYDNQSRLNIRMEAAA